MSRATIRAAAALGAAVLLLGAGACSSNDAGAPRPRQSSPGASPSSPIPATTGSLSWRRLPAIPGPPRQEVGAAEVGGTIYLAGGLVASGRATTSVQGYDPGTDAWFDAPALPTPLHHVMAAGFRGQLVVMGGFEAGLGGAASRRVMALEGTHWKDLAPMRLARGAGAAVVVGDRLIVVGGVSGAEHPAPIEIFDGSAWHLGAGMPTPRDHLGAATDGKLVYAVGGRLGGDRTELRDFDAYDPAKNVWRRLPDLPTGRSGLGAAFCAGKVIAVGGEGPRMFGETEAFDVASGSWSRLPDLILARHGIGVVATTTSVYALAGGTKVGVGPSSAAEILELNAATPA
jgi:non-specific serine/threonine protein kinase